MKSIKSRKQRKEYFNAPLHKKRKWISSHLEENLLLKYDRRSITLVKDDTVKVMRGSFKGHEGKITRVNQRRRQVEVEGLVMTKADGKKIAKPIHASNLLITKLNLTDKWRREKLERDLSEDVKKDIEREAKEQIIEVKEEQKKLIEKEESEKKETEKIEELPTTSNGKMEIKQKTVKPETKTLKKESKKINDTPSKKVTKNDKTKTKKSSEKTKQKITSKNNNVKKSPSKIQKKKKEEKNE